MGCSESVSQLHWIDECIEFILIGQQIAHFTKHLQMEIEYFVCINLRLFLDCLYFVFHSNLFIKINLLKNYNFTWTADWRFLIEKKKHHERCENIVSASCKSFILIYSNAHDWWTCLCVTCEFHGFFFSCVCNSLYSVTQKPLTT